MTPGRASAIRRSFDKTFPRADLGDRFRAHAAIKRELRRIDPRALLLSLALGGLDGVSRTLESMRRLYERLAGKTIARSSFHDRLNEGLAKVLRELVLEAIDAMPASTAATRMRIVGLRSILIADSTTIRLHPALAQAFPGTWSNHSPASVKVTVVQDLVGRVPRRLSLGPGSRHDLHQLEVDRFYRGRLLIADRAFTACWKLLDLEAHGGFYVGRIRKNMSPIIEAVHRGLRAGVIGKRVHEVLGDSRGGELDVDVRIEFQDRSSGKIVKRFHRCRLVGVRESGAFRMWITNLTREQATASEVSALYAARWEIEIFFRELKTIWRADQIPTSGEAATRCLLYASMLTVLFSRELRHALFERDARERVPLERWARLVRCLLVELAALITSRAGRSKRELHRRLDWLRRESFDPNRRRRPAHLRLADVVRDHA